MTEHPALEPGLLSVPRAETEATSFERFFREARPTLFGFLLVVTGSAHEADEVTQEAFFRVWERWDRVAGMASREAYLFRVALNVFRSRYRRTVRAAKVAISSEPAPDAFEALVARDEVWRSLARLPARQRSAILITDFLGYPSDEAAQMMHVSAGAVRTLVSRGHATLRTTLEADDE